MSSHQELHLQLLELNKMPQSDTDLTNWITAGNHLELLRKNANEDELIICATATHFNIDSLVVNEDNLNPLDKEDLLKWNMDPHRLPKSYASAKGLDDTFVQTIDPMSGSRKLRDARRLGVVRHYIGPDKRSVSYYEVAQEYAHVSQIHHQPNNTYSYFDDFGLNHPVVSITTTNQDAGITLASFKRQELELYLAATNSAMVRLFDFSLWGRHGFVPVATQPFTRYMGRNDLFYQQRIFASKCSETAGVQIIELSRPKSIILTDIT
ncbi:MAG: hypothetical protein OXH73_04030 [Caldilineaceae bacterium]|nr:hypothetical protein [Caldilineaceae bacterium]